MAIPLHVAKTDCIDEMVNHSRLCFVLIILLHCDITINHVVTQRFPRYTRGTFIKIEIALIVKVKHKNNAKIYYQQEMYISL